jgi:hypothetical protein
VVLTDAFSEGLHYSSTALERLVRVLSPGKLRLPAAVFGGPALTEEWRSLSGAEPVFSSEPQSEKALPLVKALAKALLKSQMKSQPPPPRA